MQLQASPSPSPRPLFLLASLSHPYFFSSLKLRLHVVTKSNEFENFLFLRRAAIFLAYFVSFFCCCCCFSVVLCHSLYPFGLVGVRGWDLASKALITVPTRQSSLLHEQPASASASNQSEPISIQRFGCSKKKRRGEKKIPLRRNCACMCVCVCESNFERNTHTHSAGAQLFLVLNATRAKMVLNY